MVLDPSSIDPGVAAPPSPVESPARATPPDVGAVALPKVLLRGVRDDTNGPSAREHHVALVDMVVVVGYGWWWWWWLRYEVHGALHALASGSPAC